MFHFSQCFTKGTIFKTFPNPMREIWGLLNLVLFSTIHMRVVLGRAFHNSITSNMQIENLHSFPVDARTSL